jgi:hypothetical protein
MGQAVISHPPSIGNLSIRHGTRMRFITNAAVASASITFQNLLDIFLVGTAATAVSDVFYAVKIRAVEMWAESAIGAATTVSVEYAGTGNGFVGDFKVHTDTSLGVQPAHIRAKPSPKSLVSNYQVSSTQQALSLTAPSGAVIDVELSFIQIWGGGGVAAQNAAAAVNAGAFYARGLDGLAIATTKYVPVAPATA